MKTRFALVAGAMLAVGCAGQVSDEITTDDEQTELTQDELIILRPELRFDPPSFLVSTGGVVLNVPVGSTFTVPCTQTSVPVRYRYRNAGPVGAIAHTNKMTVAPFFAVATPQAALAGGGARITGAIVNVAAVPPNTWVTLAAYLDSNGTVAESNEGNNALAVRFMRACH